MKKPELFLHFVLVLFFFSSFCYGNTVTHVSPINGIDWTFETTMGFQNFNNLRMSVESGTNVHSSEILFFYGILYHAFYEKKPFLKAQMNLGFSGIPDLYWTNFPDINHDNQILAKRLRTVQVDTHYLFPKVFGNLGRFYPFVGYTFLNFSYAPIYKDDYNAYGTNYTFQAITIGCVYHYQFTRKIDSNYYFSFAPIIFKELSWFCNFGAEFSINSTPIAFTLLIGFKNGVDNKILIENKENYLFFNSEIGANFRINLE